MEKIKEFLQKIKSIKNFEIILCLIIIAVALLIYFSVSPKEKSNDEQEVVATEHSLTDGLEARLGNILSNTSWKDNPIRFELTNGIESLYQKRIHHFCAAISAVT